MPRIHARNAFIPVSTSAPIKLDEEKTNGIHKFTIRLKGNPEKKLNFLNDCLFVSEECFAVTLYKKNRFQTRFDCIEKLSQQKINYFKVTKDNPYIFNKQKEKAFLIEEVSADRSLESGKYRTLQKVIENVGYLGTKIEKKSADYKQYQLMKGKDTLFFKNRPADYKLRIEALVNNYFESNTESGE